LGCLSTPHQWRYAALPLPSDLVKKHRRHGLPDKRQRRAAEAMLRMQACRI
jgi:hypothetical protein